MTHISIALLLITLLLTFALAAPSSAATTVKSKVGPSGERVWGFVPFGDGQTLITLTWNRRSADMFVLLSCSVDGELLTFGLGAAFQDRIQRIEAGVFGEACTIAVSSFSGSSPFQLSVESGAPDSLTSQSAATTNDEGAAAPSRFRLVRLATEEVPGLGRALARIRAMRGP